MRTIELRERIAILPLEVQKSRIRGPGQFSSVENRLTYFGVEMVAIYVVFNS